MKYNSLRKRGMSALLAAMVAVTALPVTGVLAEEVQKNELPVQFSDEKPQETGEEEVPFYRLVKKGEASESGYQETIWVDENGNPAEPESSYDVPDTGVPYSLWNSFPSSYNMEDYGELPAVRNQGKWGTCWAHAAISSIESNMIKKGLEDAAEADYSERHLAYFAHRRNEAMGDGADNYDETYGWYGGGNYYSAIDTLSGWCGAAAESEYPYVSYGDMEDLAESHRSSSVSHLTDASILDSPEDIKRAVMERGAVMCSFYSGDGTFNTAQVNVYHAAEGLGTDHAVSIVGWDDTYSRTNFNDNGRIPAEDGAWRCRNSWGASWAESGYFWISYEDTTITSFCSFEAEKADNYDNIYQYNGAGGNLYIGREKTANMFCTGSAEELRAVSIRAYKNYDYVIEVYAADDESMVVPSDGTLVYSQSGTLEYPGYHVIPLDRSVLLGSGMKYAVAVQLIAKENDTAFSYVETNENYSSARGQSFVYTGTGWVDTIDYDGVSNASVKNVFINAFTDDVAIDKDMLRQALEDAENENLEESEYTAATWAVFMEARKNAQTVYQSSNPGESEILKAITNLESARNALREAVVLIADESEFESFTKSVLSGNDYKDQTVKLLCDLDMEGIVHCAAGNENNPFEGTFDGGGYSVTNLSYQYSRFYGGLFGNVGESGTVKDVNVSYQQLELRGSYSGGIAGMNQGTVSGCKVTGENLQFQAVWTGGIVGMNEGVIRNCLAEGDFLFDCSGGTVGGIAGNNTGTIELSSVDGSIRFLNQTDTGNFVGGIAGISQGVISKCCMRGQISSDSLASVGAIVGYSYVNSEVSLCYNLASVNGAPTNDTRTAGIGACLYGNTTGCYNYGKINRTAGEEYGAIYCYKGSGTVSNCYYLDGSSIKGGYSPVLSEGALTEAEFASAKAAYDLNSNGGSGENTGVWSQSQEENVPILADSKNRAVIRVTVRQSEGSSIQASFNGVSNGMFYARAGDTAKLSAEGSAVEPGYAAAARIEGFTCLDEEENIYRLPDADAEAVIDCQKELITYNIVYHPDRGTGTGANTYDIESEVELFTPAREGAEFLGWYDNEELQGEPVVKIPKGSTGNKEFWAKWYREGYEVFFPENAGCEMKSCEGYVNGKIKDDGSYLFTVAAQTGYDITNLTIWYGETELTSADGVYRIDNIMSDIDNITVSGVKLGTGNYTAESYNGYVGETCTIRPVLPATGIRLENASEFSDSITVDTDNDISIVTRDGYGNISDAELIRFERDLTSPEIVSVEVLPESESDHFAGVYITVNADDEESGVSEYSFDNGASWQEENRYYILCKEQEEIFNQTILVRDYVGNTAEYSRALVIPAFVKYNTSVKLYADKSGYLPGEDIVLRADVTFEKMEDAESYGKVHFLSSDGDTLQSAQVWPISDTVGRAQVILPGGTVTGQGEMVFLALYDGTATVYQDSESEECHVKFANARITNPDFADIEVEQGTQTAAKASDLGSSVLPVSGTVTAGGTGISYRIAWNPSIVIDLTKEGNSVVFAGTIVYENVPAQILLPETLEVSRRVTVKKAGGNSQNPVSSKPIFKIGAAEESGPAVYQVINARKKTAMLLEVKNKNVTTLNVPATVKICGVTCKVVQIGKTAAKGCKKLKKVILGKNIATIGVQAFYNCKKLKTVQINGKAIKTIKKKAFKKTAAKITVRAKKLNKKQKAALLRKLKKEGVSKKVKVK